MNVLPLGTSAPTFHATDLRGDAVDLAALWGRAPTVLCFGRPEVHASRLVVGYLRRLRENVPDLNVLVVLQGEAEAVHRYAEGYLEELIGLHDAELTLSGLYGVTHVPSTYVLSKVGEVEAAFTGFSRPAMNKLAQNAAEATGVKAKELITALDNKGEYELAERGLSPAHVRRP